MALRIFFCVLLAIIPMAIIFDQALDSTRQAGGNIISAPFMVILVGVEIGLFKWLKHDSRSGLHAKNIALQEKEDHEAFLKEEAELQGEEEETSETA